MSREVAAEIAKLAEQLTISSDRSLSDFGYRVGTMYQKLIKQSQPVETRTEVAKEVRTPAVTVVQGCPSCKQLLRIPANLGSLRLTCPKCRFNWSWESRSSDCASSNAMAITDTSATAPSPSRGIGAHVTSHALLALLVKRFMAPNGSGANVLIRQTCRDLFGAEPTPTEFQLIAKGFDRAFQDVYGFSPFPLPPAEPGRPVDFYMVPNPVWSILDGRYELNSADEDPDAYRPTFDH